MLVCFAEERYVLPILITEGAALIWILVAPSKNWQNWHKQKFYATKFVAKMFYHKVQY